MGQAAQQEDLLEQRKMISEAQDEVIPGIEDPILEKLGFTTVNIPESANSFLTRNEQSLTAIVDEIKEGPKENRKRSPQIKAVEMLAAYMPVKP